MKKSSVYSLSIVIGVVFFSMIIMPYFFHDFKLTIDRVSYVKEEHRNMPTTMFDESTIKRLGIADVFQQIDSAYETSNACSIPDNYYETGCRAELNIKAYQTYRMIDELAFRSYSWRNHSVALESPDKLYFLYLESMNMVQYMFLGSFLSISGVLFSTWLVFRYEKGISRVQNHGVGIALGIFAVSIIFFLMRMAETELYWVS